MSRAAAERLTAAGDGAGLGAEHRHQAVAQVLVDPAAAPGDGLADLGEQTVEDEDHVVGQARLGDGGEVARVEEQYRQAALRALGISVARQTGAAAARAGGGNEARDGDGAGAGGFGRRGARAAAR